MQPLQVFLFLPNGVFCSEVLAMLATQNYAAMEVQTGEVLTDSIDALADQLPDVLIIEKPIDQALNDFSHVLHSLLSANLFKIPCVWVLYQETEPDFFIHLLNDYPQITQKRVVNKYQLYSQLMAACKQMQQQRTPKIIAQKQDNRLIFNTFDGKMYVNKADVLYCKASGKNTFIAFFANKKITIIKVFRLLKSFEEAFFNTKILRVDRSYFINTQRVRNVAIKDQACYFDVPIESELMKQQSKIRLSESGLRNLRRFIEIVE